MIKELAFYQFNFLDSINERVNARLEMIDDINCEVYQNGKYAIIIQPETFNTTGKYPEYKKVYLFSRYKESLVEVTDNDYNIISKTIDMIMRG